MPTGAGLRKSPPPVSSISLGTILVADEYLLSATLASQRCALRNEPSTMDRGRPLKHDHPPSASTSSSVASAASSVSRLKSTAGPKESVKRKPVPASASSSPVTSQKPPSTSLNDNPNDQSFLIQDSRPTLPSVSTSSPTIVPRDLDQ